MSEFVSCSRRCVSLSLLVVYDFLSRSAAGSVSLSQKNLLQNKISRKMPLPILDIPEANSQ